MISVLFDSKPENIFHYEANIHQMMINTPSEDYLSGALDTVQILREDARKRNKTFPEGEFTDVFLIFDMDPHDQMYDDGKHLLDASSIFTESSDLGKIYINYPMMQSYKHICSEDDYLGRTVSLSEIKDYKNLVNSECLPHLKHLQNYDEDTFLWMISLNLRKSNKILGGDGRLQDDTYRNLNLSDILLVQMEKYRKESSVFVLNNAVLTPLELSSTIMKKIVETEE